MFDLKLNDDNVLYISQFGSYGTCEWVKDISDIDIGVIVNSLTELDFDLEDKLADYFKKIYNYNNVNVTIVSFDVENRLTRNIICGKTLYSVIDEKDLKKHCCYIERKVHNQRTYYEAGMMEHLKNEVNNLW